MRTLLLLFTCACVPPTRTPSNPAPIAPTTGDTGSSTGTTASTTGTGDTGPLASTGDTGGPPALCESLATTVIEPAAAGPATLADSLATWQALKAAGSGDYAYVDHYVGFYRETTTVVVVQDDVVVERCLTWPYSAGYEDEEYVEVGAAVGSHAGGAPALTMEELYARCEAEIVPLDPADYYYVVVDYRADGVFRHCVAFPELCHDDCEFGYRVSSFTWL